MDSDSISLRPSDDSFIRMLDLALGPRGSSGHMVVSGQPRGSGGMHACFSPQGTAVSALNDPGRCNSPPLNMAALWADDEVKNAA